MRIKRLSIAAFGASRNLEFSNLDGGLTVVYGTNEAGKTTLMNFLRAMLYGFGGARRQRYIPPSSGERGGGAIDVATAEGRARIVRYAAGRDPQADELTLTAADGLPRRGAWLSAMLADVDEAMFNNIFAVGLDEIQELSTLSDSDAAQLLYDLSTGRDRVSLGEVARDLAAARERLVASDGRAAHVSQLLAERHRLREQAARLTAELHRLVDLSSARRRVREEISRLEGDVAHLDERARLIETAAALADRWRRRAAFDAELASLGPVQSLSLGTIEELDDIKHKLERFRRRRAILKRKQRAAAMQVKAQKSNEVLRRAAPRIEAIAEQTPFISSLESQIAQLDGETASLQEQLAVERPTTAAGNIVLGQEAPASAVAVRNMPLRDVPLPTGLDPESPRFPPLRRAAKRLRETQEQLEDAEAEAQRIRRSDEAAQRERPSTHQQRSAADLPAAIAKAGVVVAQLRRRIAVDDRLEQIKHAEMDVEDDNRHLMQDQVLPVWSLVMLGVVFAVGMGLIGWGALRWSSGAGWTGFLLTLVGLASGAAAALYKVRWEHNAQRRLDSGLRQIEALRRETKRLHDERDELDIELPSGGGPLAVRLQTAERELASLEQMLSNDARRTAGVHDVATAELRRDQCRVEHERARDRWRDALLAAGLPADFPPGRLRELGERGRNLGELERRLTAVRTERDQRRRELTAITNRVSQLATEIQLGPAAPTTPVQIIAEMVAMLRAQQASGAQYDALRQDLSALRRKRRRCRRSMEKLSHRRRQIVAASGATSDEDLHRIVAVAGCASQLRKQRDAVHEEILAAVRGHAAEQEILALLDSEEFASPDGATHEVIRRATARRDELRKLYEQRGRLDAEIHALAEDQRLAGAQFDLARVDEQLVEATERFAILSGVGRVLEMVRENYETRKQPQTLIEASAWLVRLTDGRYRRVWTPLGEHVLRVEDAAGNSLGVDVLSRGAREQLFLALRLAIIDSYAARGARLPIILDDVLVNFDVHRARAAVEALADFARSGHQVFVFTCHEHIEAMFRRAGADARRLPGSGTIEPLAIETPRPAPPKVAAADESEPRRLRVRRPKPSERARERRRGIFFKLPIVDWPYQLPVVAAPPMPPPAEAAPKPMPRFEVAAPTVEIVHTEPFVEPIIVTRSPYSPPVAQSPAPPPLPAPISPPPATPVVRPLSRRPRSAPARPTSPPPERRKLRRWRSKGWDPAIEVPIEEEAFDEEYVTGGERDRPPHASRRHDDEASRVNGYRSAPTEVWPGGAVATFVAETRRDRDAATGHVDATEAEFVDYEGVLIDDVVRIRRRDDDDASAA
ncbi:MAG: AAA family ATPase [Pirellulales bacterium]